MTSWSPDDDLVGGGDAVMPQYDEQGRQIFEIEEQPEDLVVCLAHMRFLDGGYCRRESHDDPCSSSWSSNLSDVLAVDRYQQGLEGDEDDSA